MYNILKHVEEAFEVLDKRGFAYEVPRKIFVAEIKRSSSVFTERTIAKWMRNFKELGYIRIKSPTVLERCISFDSPYVFNDGTDFETPFKAELKGDVDG